MKSDEYIKLEQRILAEIREGEDLAKERAVRDLVNVAAAVGMSVDDMLRLLDSGVTSDGLFQEIKRRQGLAQ